MTVDQNEPLSGAAALPQISQPQGSSAPSSAGQANGQQRRRRRRRKVNKVLSGPAVLGAEGQLDSTDEAPSEAVAVAPQPAAANGSANGSANGTGNGQHKQHHPKKNRQQQGGGFQNGAGQPRNFQKAQYASNAGNGGGGNGGQQQQGARRKNKQRRQAPVFVGPMDHSYRSVNGNVADGSGSGSEYRSNHRGGDRDPNGNVAPRNSYMEPYDAPAVLRDDAPTRILCFIEDLFVVAKLQETAKKLGVKVGFLKADKDIVTRLTDTPEAERPSLIVFDLNNANAKPLALIPKLKAKLKRGTSVIGFLSHLQGDLKVKAIEAGCDMVMPKSAFSQNLPNLLRRHGLEEEQLEPIEA